MRRTRWENAWARNASPLCEKAKGGGWGLIGPEAVAETYLQLARQPRSTWTFELDLRSLATGPGGTSGRAVQSAPPAGPRRRLADTRESHARSWA